MKKMLSDKVSKVITCRCCGSDSLKKWISFKDQPPANALVADPRKEEDTFPLDVLYCTNCELIQLGHVVNPDILFGDYKYLSSTSEVFRKHFKDMATWFSMTGMVHKDDLIVDIGSNDGILLKPFQEALCRVVGVEPCEAIAKQANDDGVPTVSEYFTVKTALSLRKKYGKARLITMTNVFAHVDNLTEIIDGVYALLDPDDGFFMIEFPDTMEMIKQGTFDLIYHEHLSYFTVPSIVSYFLRKGFEIVEITRQPVHGGSLRVIVRPHKLSVPMLLGDKAPKMNKKILDWYIKEVGFTNERAFTSFPSRVKENMIALKALLQDIRDRHELIIGYGAPAKMATLTNSFDIGTSLVASVIDDSPEKQGLRSPMKHLAIHKMPENIGDLGIDYILIFAWNFAESIMQKLHTAGYKGKYIIPYPHARIVEYAKGKHAKTSRK